VSPDHRLPTVPDLAAVRALCDEFGARFVTACEACGIPARRLRGARARALEPNLHPAVRLAVQVPDGTLDAWRLPLMFCATARRAGAEIRTFTRAIGLEREGSRVAGVRVLDLRTNREHVLPADVVINAAGPWAGQVAALVGLSLDVRAVAGVLVAVKGRLANMVISRLDLPGDGDILVPQRNLSILGTTAWIAPDPDVPACPETDVRLLLERGAELVPAVRDAEVRAAWAAVRPLVGNGQAAHGRELSRTFRCFDHALAPDRVEGLMSITGGKATTLRAMAETTVDRVCEKLGVRVPCATRTARLLPYDRAFV